MEKVFDHSVKTDVGLVRKANEDAAGYAPSEEVCNNGDLFIVCDGMGGHVGGAIASNTAVQSIIDHFKNGLHENPYIAINDAIVFANEQIFARAQAEPELKGMGTTCTVLLIRGSETFIGHVGDSRIYIQSKNKLHRITKDHSFVQTLVDQGLISDGDAESHPRKNELIKALGIRESVEPEVCSKAIEAVAGDCFMMCSDGLCGLVVDQDMEKVISDSISLDNKADKLIAMAKAAGGHDNITVALVDIQSSPFTSSVFVDFTPKESMSTTGDMSPLAATQEIGGLASDSPSVLPLWKRSGVLVSAAVVAVAIIVLVFFNPFKGSVDEDGVSNIDSTAQELVGPPLENVEEKNCESNYFSVILGEDGFESMSQATDTLHDRAGDSYDTKCLVYEELSGKITQGDEVRLLDKIQLGERVYLDCDCLDSNQSSVIDNTTNNQSNDPINADNKMNGNTDTLSPPPPKVPIGDSIITESSDTINQ